MKTEAELMPAQSLEAEMALLGAIIMDESIIRHVELTPEDFYRSAHGNIYRAMLVLQVDGIPVDFASVASKLPTDEKSILLSAANETVTTANFRSHAEIIRESALKRRIRQVCQSVINGVNEASIDESLTKLQLLSGIVTKNRGGAVVTMQEIVKDLVEFVDRRYKHRHEMSGIASGLKDLDALTDGFQNGDMILLAGRPGQGKSCLMMSIAQNASQQGYPVGIISLEMGPHQLGIRTMASMSGIELWKIRKGILKREEFDNLTASAGPMSELPIYFSFLARTSLDIEKVSTQMIDRGCKMIMLDYIQLAKGADHRSREREVAEVSICLKTIAQRHNIPVLAIAQLNREVEKREQKKPLLADLRDSGALEQDADVIMFLYPSQQEGNVSLSVSKGRNIGTGEIELLWQKDIMKFGDLHL